MDGQTISLTGSAVTAVALPLAAISVLGASAFEVGLLTAATLGWLSLGQLFAVAFAAGACAVFFDVSSQS